jgi:hypothetical protein
MQLAPGAHSCHAGAPASHAAAAQSAGVATPPTPTMPPHCTPVRLSEKSAAPQPPWDGDPSRQRQPKSKGMDSRDGGGGGACGGGRAAAAVVAAAAATKAAARRVCLGLTLKEEDV